MDLSKLKSFIDDKSVAIETRGSTIHVNCDIGNDNAWVEFEIANTTDEEQMAAIINNYISKVKTGKVNQLDLRDGPQVN